MAVKGGNFAGAGCNACVCCIRLRIISHDQCGVIMIIRVVNIGGRDAVDNTHADGQW